MLKTSTKTTKSRKSRIPKNLKELIEGDQSGYVIKTIYVLQLKHGLMGFFPAIFRGSTRIVITLDVEVLKKVWLTLTPRQSEVVTNMAYVNEELGVAYPILEGQAEESKPQRFIAMQEVEELLARNKQTFGWAPGLVSNGMSHDEFLRTIEAARAQHVA